MTKLNIESQLQKFQNEQSTNFLQVTQKIQKLREQIITDHGHVLRFRLSPAHEYKNQFDVSHYRSTTICAGRQFRAHRSVIMLMGLVQSYGLSINIKTVERQSEGKKTAKTCIKVQLFSQDIQKNCGQQKLFKLRSSFLYRLQLIMTIVRYKLYLCTQT